jgi:hypothetical protein
MIAATNHSNFSNQLDKVISGIIGSARDESRAVKKTIIKTQSRSKVKSASNSKSANSFIHFIALSLAFIRFAPKAIAMYSSTSRLLRILNKSTKDDYKKFLESDERGKEDIIINWERTSRKLDRILLKVPQTELFWLKPSQKNIHIIESVIKTFTAKIHFEFYGDLNKPRSQEDLKKSASKFNLSKDMLEDLISDKF